MSLLASLNAAIRARFTAVFLAVLVVGYFLPEPGSALRGLSFFNLPGLGWRYDYPTVAQTLVMLASSVQCDPAAFLDLGRRRGAALLSLASFYALVPLLAWLVAGAATALLPAGEASGQLQAGLLFIAVMPVAVTSAFWVRHNEGNLSLLFSALILTSALSAVSVPLYMQALLGGQASVTVPARGLVQQIVLVITLPLLAGTAWKVFAPAAMAACQPVLGLLGSLGQLSIAWMTVAAARPHLDSAGPLLAGAAAIVVASNLLYFLAGYGAARLGALRREEAVTLTYMSGMRNHGASMVVGLASFPDQPLVTIPAVLYGLSQQVVGGSLSRLFRAR